MFGVNAGELAVIAIVALIVIGPERLPHYAEKLGQLVREGRRMAMGLREQVRDEIGPEFDEVDWRQLDPRQYDPRRIVREALKDTFDEPAAKPARTTRTPTKTPVRPPKPNAGADAPFDDDAT